MPGTEAYAVYTDYETPFDVVSSAYTLIIGRRGEAIGPGRDDLVVARIPASARDVVVVSDSRPESIVEAWAGIWARQDLPRDYRADVIYLSPPHNRLPDRAFVISTKGTWNKALRVRYCVA